MPGGGQYGQPPEYDETRETLSEHRERMTVEMVCVRAEREQWRKFWEARRPSELLAGFTS
jgi:hypothetical protein